MVKNSSSVQDFKTFNFSYKNRLLHMENISVIPTNLALKFNNDNRRVNALKELQCDFVIYGVEVEENNANRDFVKYLFSSKNGYHVIKYPVVLKMV